MCWYLCKESATAMETESKPPFKAASDPKPSQLLKLSYNGHEKQGARREN